MKLAVKEAAKAAGVSQALIYEWCHERRLKHYRFGTKGRRGKILIEESDLAAFLESCTVGPDTAAVGALKHIRLPGAGSP
jgi:excisionase family DNA binding protein